jgi:hypothetical protein
VKPGSSALSDGIFVRVVTVGKTVIDSAVRKSDDRIATTAVLSPAARGVGNYIAPRACGRAWVHESVMDAGTALAPLAGPTLQAIPRTKKLCQPANSL